jgi:KDO2-lipid IV(A) lauroyltransferase
MSDRVAEAAYSLAWRGARLAPEAVVRGSFQLGASLTARCGGTGTLQLRQNLARVARDASRAELDALTRAGLRSYARYWSETFRLPTTSWPRVRDRCVITGLEHFDAARERGHGVVVALTHSGNWDVAGLWLSQIYGRFSTVVERLRPESVYRRFAAYRESLGFEVLAAGGGKATVQALLSRLRAGGVVALLADRDLSAAGPSVSFFGEPARLPTGPARLAARTGAPILPVGSAFTPSGWAFRVHPPVLVGAATSPQFDPKLRGDSVDVRGATQALADRFAEDIACHPADWHMLQRVFAADRPAPVGSTR